jgi:hypothetical protein
MIVPTPMPMYTASPSFAPLKYQKLSIVWLFIQMGCIIIIILAIGYAIQICRAEEAEETHRQEQSGEVGTSTDGERIAAGESLARTIPSILYEKSKHFQTRRVLNEIEEEDEDEICSICLCNFREEQVKELQCGHCFHADCLDTWLKLKVLCPLCKRVVVAPAVGTGSDTDDAAGVSESEINQTAAFQESISPSGESGHPFDSRSRAPPRSAARYFSVEEGYGQNLGINVTTQNEGQRAAQVSFSSRRRRYRRRRRQRYVAQSGLSVSATNSISTTTAIMSTRSGSNSSSMDTPNNTDVRVGTSLDYTG